MQGPGKIGQKARGTQNNDILATLMKKFALAEPKSASQPFRLELDGVSTLSELVTRVGTIRHGCAARAVRGPGILV